VSDYLAERVAEVMRRSGAVQPLTRRDAVRLAVFLGITPDGRSATTDLRGVAALAVELADVLMGEPDA
jgi:hypothetical protein